MSACRSIASRDRNLFLPDNKLMFGRSLVTRMFCKFLGLLYPIIGCTSTSFLVPELLYRIGHNSNSHSLIRGKLGLKSKIRNIFFSVSVETLLTMHAAQTTEADQSDHTTSNAALELQEPIVTTVSQATELIIDRPNVPIENQHIANLLDAMDKVVNHKDVSFAEPSNWLKFCDCMDLITGWVSELVETVNLANLFVMDQIEIAPCRAELVRIKLTPMVKLPTLQTSQDLIALGEYFTRSKLKLKQHRKNRRPCNASTDIDYNKDTPSSGADKKSKRKWTKNKPPADGPSASRVGAQLTSTGISAV